MGLWLEMTPSLFRIFTLYVLNTFLIILILSRFRGLVSLALSIFTKTQVLYIGKIFLSLVCAKRACFYSNEHPDGGPLFYTNIMVQHKMNIYLLYPCIIFYTYGFIICNRCKINICVDRFADPFTLH